MVFVSLSGAVLAGGQGVRMGGQDKGLLLFQEEPMVMCVARSLGVVVDSIFVNANRNIEQYSLLGFDVTSDSKAFNSKGPLSGLFTCLAYASSSHLLVSPCDTPCISWEAFEKLKDTSKTNPNIIHYLTSSSGDHPLHAILPVESAKSSLEKFLGKAERYNVMAFYEQFGCQKVLWDKDNELLNVNMPDSLS